MIALPEYTLDYRPPPKEAAVPFWTYSIHRAAPPAPAAR
jgi:hypothetical protein